MNAPECFEHTEMLQVLQVLQVSKHISMLPHVPVQLYSMKTVCQSIVQKKDLIKFDLTTIFFLWLHSDLTFLWMFTIAKTFVFSGDFTPVRNLPEKESFLLRMF